MAKKKARPRLKVGDRVKVIKVPKYLMLYGSLVGKVGRVCEDRRTPDKLWRVKLQGGERRLFLRHELKKL